jgi:GNAT superfamily N-acetyltransferase
MRVRDAVLADIPRLHEVRLAVYENVLADSTRVTAAHYRKMLARDGRGWVCEINHQIVGFGIADRRCGNIWALFVSPGFEGRGIGSRLLQTMVDYLFTEGLERAWLTTAAGTRAERFYRAAGWRVTGVSCGGELHFELVNPRSPS